MSGVAARFARLERRDPASSLSIRPGTIADYEALAALHYRAGRPATVELVLVSESREQVAGVLVVSRPTLNGRWRALAWLGEYRSGNARVDATKLNAEVRTISRVVVEPRFRALGVATRLVRAYLAAPITIRTEALAAMGAACPFFAAAGMKEWRLEPAARDVRLRRAMREQGVGLMELLEVRGARRVEMALRVWADAARGTRRFKRATVGELGRIAAGALMCPMVAYTHEVRSPLRGEEEIRSGFPRVPLRTAGAVLRFTRGDLARPFGTKRIAER